MIPARQRWRRGEAAVASDWAGLLRLATEALVRRDGKWSTVDARELVVGDVVRLRLGDLVPADARLVDGSVLDVDQSALTGESLPVNAMDQGAPAAATARR